MPALKACVLLNVEPDRDAAPMLALLNDPGFVRFIGDRNVRSEEQARDYIALRVLHSYALNGFGMYAIERLSDGARASVRLSSRAAGATSVGVGTLVTVSLTGAGVLLSAAGQVLAFIPNAMGEALLANEQVTR